LLFKAFVAILIVGKGVHVKGILEFNLPEEQSEHRHALEGGLYRCEIADFAAYLRKQIKYDLDEDLKELLEDNKIKKPHAEILIDFLRTKLFEHCEESLNGD
jgi:hypothetical protein